MQHLDGADTSASESTSTPSTKTLPITLNGDRNVQAISPRNKVAKYEQRPKGRCAPSAEFNVQNTIAKYRNMAVKSYIINPTDYSYNWYVSYSDSVFFLETARNSEMLTTSSK